MSRAASLLAALTVSACFSACAGGLEDDELRAFENYARGIDSDGGAADADGGGQSSVCDDVPALLRGSCAIGCHGSEVPSGGLDLASPSLATRLGDVSPEGTSCGEGKFIDFSAPEQSLIYTQLAAKPECGSPMPLGGMAFTDEQRACVLAWIKDGAKESPAASGNDAGIGGEDPTPGGNDAGTPPVDVAVGTELTRTGWTATASRTGTQDGVSGVEAVLDGSLTTRWGTGIPQDGSLDFVQVDMKSAQKFTTIELRMGMYDQDHPRNYKVFASNDPAAFGAAIAMGTTQDIKQQVVTITVPVQTARYLRIENTGVDSDNWWSIYELVVKR